MAAAGNAEKLNEKQSSHEQFLAMLEAHQLWLQSEGKEGKRANLRGYDLSYMPFEEMDLSEASLRGANLTGADLSRVLLRGSDLSEAVLQDATLQGTMLEEANLARADLRQADLRGALLNGANLMSANAEQADLREASFKEANLREANLHRANLSHALLIEANLRGAYATEAIFNQANLTLANCRNTNFTSATFGGAILLNTQCRGANFSQVAFGDADFSQALEIEMQYQSESIESEKQNIVHEVQNLERMREEIAQFEHHIRREKRQVEHRKKLLDSLDKLDATMLANTKKQAGMFRVLSLMWFVMAAMITTLFVYQFGLGELTGFFKKEWILTALAGAIILAIHLYTAIASFQAYKNCLHYLRDRRGYIKRYSQELPDSLPTAETIEEVIVPHEDEHAEPDAVTVL